MNGRTEMLFARSDFRGLGIEHQLATRGTPEKHRHCIRPLEKKISVLKKQSKLLDCTDLDTSFPTLKRVYYYLKSKTLKCI